MENLSYFQAQFTSNKLINGISIPNIPLSIPSNAAVRDLNSLLNQLLLEIDAEWKPVNFEFLIFGQLLRETVEEHVKEKTLTTEDVLQIECIIAEPEPSPEFSLPHEDWVSAVISSEKNFITGCYDNTFHVWSAEGDHLAKFSGHAGPVKCLAWRPEPSDNTNTLKFVSGSHDQTLMLWSYDLKLDSHCCHQIFRGHERSVECVAVSNDGNRIASGSFDANLKIWSLGMIDKETGESDNTGKPGKRRKNETGKAEKHSKIPIVTLAGHREAVTGAIWTHANEVATCSWDHTIVLWDLELAGQKALLPGRTAFTDIDYSLLNNQLLSASSDRFVRLWDPRSKDSSFVKAKFSSHTGWISAVRWSKTNSNCFVSASYDQTSKMWDVRNSKSPLYDLTGHEEKLLCIDWSSPEFVVSGGADCAAKIYRTSGGK